MMRQFRGGIAFLLLLLAFVTCLSTATSVRLRELESPTMRLKRVVFTHRHGARTPTSNVNGSCDALGCGTLTHQGALMLVSLGKAFRENYGDLLPNWYDTEKIKSVSDSCPRVIQSSTAFISGLFDYNASYTPYAATNTDGGYAIGPWSAPSFALHKTQNKIETVLNITSTIAKRFISFAEITAIGKEMGLSPLECDLLPAACYSKEMDFLESMKAMGRLDEFPLGKKYYSNLTAARQFAQQMLEGRFDVDVLKNSFFRDAGYPGWATFDAMVRSCSSSHSDGPVLVEYSGHDTTLMPLYVAMGNLSFAYPSFATALIFEVYSRKKKKSTPAGNTEQEQEEDWIRPLLGTTDQLPGKHPYTFHHHEVFCMDKNGSTYSSTGVGCPLQDLRRYKDSRVGAFQARCYAWPPDAAVTLCDRDGPADPTSPCGWFREACPFTACGEGKYMTSDLACKKT